MLGSEPVCPVFSGMPKGLLSCATFSACRRKTCPRIRSLSQQMQLCGGLSPSLTRCKHNALSFSFGLETVPSSVGRLGISLKLCPLLRLQTAQLREEDPGAAMGNTVLPLRSRFVTFRELCKCLPLWEPPLCGEPAMLTSFPFFSCQVWCGFSLFIPTRRMAVSRLFGSCVGTLPAVCSPHGVSLCAWQMSPLAFRFLRLVS